MDDTVGSVKKIGWTKYVWGMVVAVLLLANTAAVSGDDCRVKDADIADHYEGECKNGLAHGKGIARGRDVYEGDFKDGLSDGEGRYTWFNGDSYTGSWKKGRRDGWGRLRRPSGAYYEGEWKSGKRHGNGAYKWQNGAYYEGEWADDERHGAGVLYGSDNSYYKGEWKHNKQHGKGLYKWADGSYVKGEWQNGYRVKEEKHKLTVMLASDMYDVIEEESARTGESVTDVIIRAIRCLGGEKSESP